MDPIKELTKKIIAFRDARDWKQFHSHKNMAIDLALEAAEVLEHFQWKTDNENNEYAKTNKDEIAQELADVGICLLELADNLDVDLAGAIEKKLKINRKKYPVEKAKGKHTKYNKL